MSLRDRLSRAVRRDLRTVVLALVVSSTVVATPSIAAKVVNADKVDGKSAVGAKAGVNQRRGKLVATDGRGYLPGDIVRKVGDADRLDGIDSASLVPRTATPGSVQTGLFSAWGGGDGSYTSDAVTFASQLPVALPAGRVQFVAYGAAKTAECPGQGKVVPRGYLCVYEVWLGGSSLGAVFASDEPDVAVGASPRGFVVYNHCTAPQCWSYGSYAVRAGSPRDVQRTASRAKGGHAVIRPPLPQHG